MPKTWASVVRDAHKMPTPDERLKALAAYYRTLSPKTILEEALGKQQPYLPRTPRIARPLVEHTIVICMDTESHTLNTDQMTEIGLNFISRKTASDLGTPGPHGCRLQEGLKFLHFRVVEHAHLKSNREDSKGPLGNRFGHTRFATFAELRIILHHLFNQNIKSDRPDLKGCKSPIILVGHALRHDTENTTKKGLEYKIDDNLTVVAKVDTQALAREVGVWIPQPGMYTNEIGLRVMIEKLGFQHLDDHTACNDAARTMMCAIHMVLPDSLRQPFGIPSMQEIADRIEASSKTTSPAPYGTIECCTRCGARDHSLAACKTSVVCEACRRFARDSGCACNMRSHIEMYCPHVALFKAWARRYRDARTKNRLLTPEVAAGPGADAHPWSTWPRKIEWPLDELDNVLEGLDLVEKHKEFEQLTAVEGILKAALGGLAVPKDPLGNSKSTVKATPAHPSTKGASSVARPPNPPRSKAAAASKAYPPTTSRSRAHSTSNVVHPPKSSRSTAAGTSKPRANNTPRSRAHTTTNVAHPPPSSRSYAGAASRYHAPVTPAQSPQAAAPARREITMSEERARHKANGKKHCGRYGVGGRNECLRGAAAHGSPTAACVQWWGDDEKCRP
ncbi:hypothetical protein C7974DRAFT_413049 [Boeremia exigua]|uniref:uncharacterized protein n=1 Tax=Boeremia exigua TaxID=749465 RepID=UPI001E8E526B|nr:uncharacterized protein C7974DRAFT_413049 [Boeremia exigua]KAH6629234.1 hypothetical protein C7974DRAFT_413049 [Boeremia exigua]